MAFAAIVDAEAQSTDALSVTTGAVSTTGATLIVVVGVCYQATPAITDSASNTWTNLTLRGATADPRVRISYVVSPTTSGTHTFTNTGAYASIYVSAWSGINTSTPFDQESGTDDTTAGTSIQPGSLTPVEANCLVICGCGLTGSTSGVPSINAPFTATGAFERTGGSNSSGGGSGYVIQTTATARNPTWSWTNSVNKNAAMAVFRAAAAGGRTTKNTRHTDLGRELGMDLWGHL